MKLLEKLYWLFSSTGATFADAEKYCREQYYYELGKKLNL